MANQLKNSLQTLATSAAAPKKRKRKKRNKSKRPLDPQKKLQQLQRIEIRGLMKNIGFTRIPKVDKKEFVYEERRSELDDVFFLQNVIVLMEYTVGSPGTHLLKKKIIYDLINDNPPAFIKFLIKEPKFKDLTEVLKKQVLSEYTLSQLQVKVVYASREKISGENKKVVKNVCFFDYYIVKYFGSLSKTIKKSCRFEFLNFLGLNFSKIGPNIKSTAKNPTNEFSGHILPEEHSSFKNGYKLISFYMDANSLMRRAFVLRKDSWRYKDSIGLYQRMLGRKKIMGMRKYLHEKRRVFVNNIIVTLPFDKIKLFDINGKELTLDKHGNFKFNSLTNITPATVQIKDEPNIIGIVDGQHRSYAYHEGEDSYEKTIAKMRDVQNLLITGILYPEEEEQNKRIKFEAELFLEINSTQTGAKSDLKQGIEYILNPFSTTSIAKDILNKLNESGPLGTVFEEYWFEESKLKTSSIISFGLKPIIKLDGKDSLFTIWKDASKSKLKGSRDQKLLNTYKEFCVEQIRNIFIGLKANILPQNWKKDVKDPNAILTVTTVNGVINCLRMLVENNKTGSAEYYKKHFVGVNNFKFKDYKSSQYRRLGEELYSNYFDNQNQKQN
jgi:DGQHR domain-containing protein